MSHQLPFKDRMNLCELDGTPVNIGPDSEGMKCSVWPARASASRATGEVFDHTGEAPREFAGQLEVANRCLIDLVTEERYRIVSATTHPFVPHVGLELLRVRSASS